MGNNQPSTSGRFKIPDQLLTGASFATLGGCAVTAWVVTSVLCGVFKISQGPTGLIVSILVALTAVLVSSNKNWRNYVVAVFNGFLIYLTIVGGTSFTPYVNPKTSEEVSKPRIIKPWIPDINLVRKSAQQEQVLSNVETQLNRIDADITTAPTLSEPQKKLLIDKVRLSRKIIHDTK